MLDLAILPFVHHARTRSGLKNNNEDSKVYQRHCTIQIKHIRRRLGIQQKQKKKKIIEKSIDEKLETTDYLRLLLFLAERSYTIYVNCKNVNAVAEEFSLILKRKALRKLRKSVTWAKKLESFCNKNCGEMTLLEASAYFKYLQGLYSLELKDGERNSALTNFDEVYSIYEHLLIVSNQEAPQNSIVYKQRLSQLKSVLKHNRYRNPSTLKSNLKTEIPSKLEFFSSGQSYFVPEFAQKIIEQNKFFLALFTTDQNLIRFPFYQSSYSFVETNLKHPASQERVNEVINSIHESFVKINRQRIFEKESFSNFLEFDHFLTSFRTFLHSEILLSQIFQALREYRTLSEPRFRKLLKNLEDQKQLFEEIRNFSDESSDELVNVFQAKLKSIRLLTLIILLHSRRNCDQQKPGYHPRSRFQALSLVELYNSRKEIDLPNFVEEGGDFFLNSFFERIDRILDEVEVFSQNLFKKIQFKVIGAYCLPKISGEGRSDVVVSTFLREPKIMYQPPKVYDLAKEEYEKEFYEKLFKDEGKNDGLFGRIGKKIGFWQ